LKEGIPSPEEAADASEEILLREALQRAMGPEADAFPPANGGGSREKTKYATTARVPVTRARRRKETEHEE
jgi:hypothetical protein